VGAVAGKALIGAAGGAAQLLQHVLGGGAVEDGDARALCRQAPRHVAPYAAAGAGDEHGARGAVLPGVGGGCVGTHRQSSRSRAAPFSPTMVLGAVVLPPGMVGKMELSITRRPCTPCTR